MAKMIVLELIRTNFGIFAIHRHASRPGGHEELDDPSFCFGWQREGPGRWRQRHLTGYGTRCPKCHKDMPDAAALDTFYEEMIKDGTEGLQYTDVKHGAGGALL